MTSIYRIEIEAIQAAIEALPVHPEQIKDLFTDGANQDDDALAAIILAAQADSTEYLELLARTESDTIRGLVDRAEVQRAISASGGCPDPACAPPCTAAPFAAPLWLAVHGLVVHAKMEAGWLL